MINKKELEKYYEQVKAIIWLFLFVSIIFGLLIFMYPDSLEGEVTVLPTRHRSVKSLEDATNTIVVASRLDGLEVATEEESNPYPVAIMMDNYLSVKKQAGLNQASLIYETLAEGGTTRYLAIFDINKEINLIGPVRSARPYFVEWAASYNAFYIHAGGSPAALALLDQKEIDHLDEISGWGPKYFYRDNNYNAPHNLFTNSTRLGKALLEWELDKPEYQSFEYKSESDIEDRGADEQEVYIDFTAGVNYDAKFIYNQHQNVYNRYRQDKIAIDLNDNKIVTAKNVIVQFIPDEIVLDDKLRIDLDIQGSGDGLLFQDGKVSDIKWKKDGFDSQTKYSLVNNKPIRLNSGLTWIVVVPGDREVKH